MMRNTPVSTGDKMPYRISDFVRQCTKPIRGLNGRSGLVLSDTENRTTPPLVAYGDLYRTLCEHPILTGARGGARARPGRRPAIPRRSTGWSA